MLGKRGGHGLNGYRIGIGGEHLASGCCVKLGGCVELNREFFAVIATVLEPASEPFVCVCAARSGPPVVVIGFNETELLVGSHQVKNPLGFLVGLVRASDREEIV